MEQCRMNSQQLAHNAHDAASLDILQFPFYPSFPEPLDGSKVAQAPYSLPSYVQQQYAPDDSGASLEDGGSPLHILQQPQQGRLHGDLDPVPTSQRHQLYPAVAHPPFPHDDEGPYPTPQGPSHQLSRASAHSARRPNDAFSDNPSTHPTTLRGGISPIYDPPYTLRPQPPYHPPPPHRSASTHAPLEQSQPNAAPGPSTLHEQHEDREITVQGQRSHPWGGAGSLDPVTGVFCPATVHHRIRTTQACEKCRERKAKCTGQHPCQRCHERGLECKYAPERRMRGPNKPKPILFSMPDGSPQPAVAVGQKTRKRASTLPTVQRRLQILGQQQQQKQKQSQRQQEQTVVAAAAAAATSPASPASSVGSGSLGYPFLSESEGSPMTPHSSLDGRHSTGVIFPASSRILVQDCSANTRPVVSQVDEGNRYSQGGDYDSAAATESMVGVPAGTAYGLDVFPDLGLSLSFENPKTF